MVVDGPAPLEEQSRLHLRERFDDEAQRYASRRPTYPDALFDRLAAYGHLTAGARVLEVAPGPGQATRSMAERSWTVTAVELGASLAATARNALADFDHVEVITGAFEDWPLPPRPFDAVVCATAWHWLDPDVRLAKAVQALRPSGTVAIVWTHHVAGGTRSFFPRAQECYREWDPHTPEEVLLPSEKALVPFTAELDTSLLVSDVESHAFPVELTYTTEDYLDLLRTYSPTIRLAKPQREGLLGCLRQLIARDFGGHVTKRYVFELVLARKPIQ